MEGRDDERGDLLMEGAPILWRRLDRPGHEAARATFRDGRWRLSGCALFEDEAGACCLEYDIFCDDAWATLFASVTGWIGSEQVDARIEVGDGRWTLNGAPVPEVDGAIDVDLNFSPATNLLPIRRLGLAVGSEATVRAAWLRFPSFRLEPLEQTYRRTAPSTWRYESAGGRFAR
ncbi:MAG TPA: putative glycolipid-binding domain-containing protein, partial [Thermoanaerobaculia bacterium]